MIDYVTGPRFFVEGIEVLATRIVGNNVWQLVQDHREGGRKGIALALIKAAGGDWGYKGLDESWGPCEVNCPLALLNAADAPCNTYAAEWRERVRTYHAGQSSRPAYAAGQVWRYGERDYRLVRQAGPRRGWEVVDQMGNTFRIKFTQLSKATLVA